MTHVDVARVAQHDALVNNRFRPAGQPPFALIGTDDSNDLADFFDAVFATVSHGARDFAGDAGSFGRNLFDRLKRFFRNV